MNLAPVSLRSVAMCRAGPLPRLGTSAAQSICRSRPRASGHSRRAAAHGSAGAHPKPETANMALSITATVATHDFVVTKRRFLQCSFQRSCRRLCDMAAVAAAAFTSDRAEAQDLSWMRATITIQQKQQRKERALRVLQQQQLDWAPHRPHYLKAFAAPPESDAIATFVVATTVRATETTAADSAQLPVEATAGAATGRADNSVDAANRIENAYLRGDCSCLAAVASEQLPLLEQPQRQGSSLLAPALLLLSLLRPPQRDHRIQRVVVAVREAVQQQEQSQLPSAFTPGECAALICAFGNLGMPATAECFIPCLAESPFGGEAAASLARLLVSIRRQRLLRPRGFAAVPASAATLVAPSEAFPLLHRLLECPDLSPRQSCCVLQAAAYAAFFPQQVSLLLVPACSTAQAAVSANADSAATARRCNGSISSPAPVYLETLPGQIETTDTPERLGLATRITAATCRVAEALNSNRETSGNEEALSIESIFRFAEALMLRDISFVAQLNLLALQQQQTQDCQKEQGQPHEKDWQRKEHQQVHQVFAAYKKELDEIIGLLLNSILRQRKDWGLCLLEEFLSFFIALLRLLGIGNPERLALAATLKDSRGQQKMQQQEQQTWRTLEKEPLGRNVYAGLRDIWLHLSDGSSNNGSNTSLTAAALHLRAVALLCSSTETLDLMPLTEVPCGVAAAAAAAASPATSFGIDMEGWGQQQLLQWQLAAAADFTPIPVAAMQQQQRFDTYVYLAQQKQRAAQLQARTAALLLRPTTTAEDVVASEATSSADTPTVTKAARQTAGATAVPDEQAVVTVSPPEEVGLRLPALLREATESIFRFSTSVSPVALLVLRSLIALNSLQIQSRAPLSILQQLTEAWELLLTCSSEELLQQQEAATAAAATFRAFALLHLYRSMQWQKLALLKQLRQRQQDCLKHDQQKHDLQQRLQQEERLRHSIRQLRRSMFSVRWQQITLLDSLRNLHRERRPPKETAAILVALAAGSLLRPAHVKVLTPSLLEGLQGNQQQQEQPLLHQKETTAAVISLLTLKCLLPEGSVPEELLTYVLHAARDAAAALQPREIAVALYSLRPQTHKGLSLQALLPLQDLRRRLLQQSAFLLPYFLPEDLLVFLASVEDAPPELMRQAFGFMYTAIPYYTPQQLASAFILFCKSNVRDARLRLRLLLQLLAYVDALSPTSLCGVAEALAGTDLFGSMPRQLPPTYVTWKLDMEQGEESKPRREKSTAQTTEDAGNSHEASLQQEWAKDLVQAIFNRSVGILSGSTWHYGTAAAAAAAAATARLLCCCAALPVTEEHQKILKNVLMQPPPGQLHIKQQMMPAKTTKSQTKSQPRRPTARLLWMLKPRLLLQLLLVELHQWQLQQHEKARDFVFGGTLCGALRRHLQELSTEDLLSLLAALHATGLPPREGLRREELASKGYLPLRFCWKLGSLLKRDINNYKICMHTLSANALALHFLGVWTRLSARTQAAILARLEEHDRRRLPLPPATERKRTTPSRLRVKNLALVKPRDRTPGAPSLLLVPGEKDELKAPMPMFPTKTAIELFKEVVSRS